MNDGVKIEGDLNWSFDRLEREFPRYANAALYAGSSVLKEETKEQMLAKLPAAAHRNPRYDDTLLDAVRNTRADGNEVSVHILGSRAPGSGTYRARFFEGGTKERFQKTYRGKPLKKKHKLGSISAKHFLEDAAAISEPQVLQAMEDVINRLFEENG